MDKQDKERIVAIVVKMVAGMISKGEVDPSDDAALKAAAKKCAPIARSAYYAALEFVS
jgi:hypothetical protein